MRDFGLVIDGKSRPGDARLDVNAARADVV